MLLPAQRADGDRPPTSPVRLPAGFEAAGTWCGIKEMTEQVGGEDAPLDLGLLLAPEAAPAVAVFTRNRLLGAHIPLCREHLARSGGHVRAVLVTSGCANCATGRQGVEDARALCRGLADRIGCPPEQVLTMATGAIGTALPVERIVVALDPLLARATPEGGADFARAIMTTDTRPKARHATAASGTAVSGFAKGSGMIHPDMATLLGFLLTDGLARGASAGLPALLARLVDRSFHRVTVDGDTSPNDTVLLWGRETEGGGSGSGLEEALSEVACGLARDVAADGEGASRMVTLHVTGAADEDEAARVGRAIARSPLVKTALAGGDANWGRIVSAACACGEPLDPARLRLAIGPAEVYREGEPRPDLEPRARAHLAGPSVRLALDLGRGTAAAELWTCDLTTGYVEINAHYRT